MRRPPPFVRGRGLVLVLPVAVAALTALAGCSSGKASVPPAATTSTTDSASTGSSTSSTNTTATTTPAATTTTGGGATTTTTKAPVVFTNFTISPASPVECNAPTMIELKWTANGVKSVDLLIDGKHAATFGGGAQDHLEYFACDGKKHNYALTAKRGTTTETVSRDVVSRVLS